MLGKTKHILDHKSLHILYCSLVLPYLNYCVEIWGNTYKTNLKPLCILQKKAIRIANKAGYLDHTNILFLQSHIMKLMDLVEYKTALIMYKARKNILPGNIQKMFNDREGGYNLRREQNFKVQCVKLKSKSMCISVCGVQLWNRMSTALQLSPNMSSFKRAYKNIIFGRYQDEEGRC